MKEIIKIVNFKKVLISKFTESDRLHEKLSVQ